MTQFKDKTAGAGGREHRRGALRLPRAQAADILLYQADAVPIGEDQKQHVELTRDVAERFNNAFGKAFVVPEPIIREGGARVMGLDDPTRKMSKSAGSENSYIAVMDPPDVIRRKIRRAVTDSGTRGPRRPGQARAHAICSTSTARSPATRSTSIERRYEGKGYADLKADLGEVVVEALAPIQGAHPRARGRQELHARRAQDRRRARRGHRRAHARQGPRARRARAASVASAPGSVTLRDARGRLPRAAFLPGGLMISIETMKQRTEQMIGEEFPLVFWRGKGRIVGADERRPLPARPRHERRLHVGAARGHLEPPPVQPHAHRRRARRRSRRRRHRQHLRRSCRPTASTSSTPTGSWCSRSTPRPPSTSTPT